MKYENVMGFSHDTTHGPDKLRSNRSFIDFAFRTHHEIIAHMTSSNFRIMKIRFYCKLREMHTNAHDSRTFSVRRAGAEGVPKIIMSSSFAAESGVSARMPRREF